MAVLSKLRIRTKLALICAIATIAIGASVAIGGSMIRDRMMVDRGEKLGAVVRSAIGFAESLEREVTAGRLDRAQAVARFRDALHLVRFGTNDDYLLVQDPDGVVLIHGGDPKREGKPTASRDASGRSTAELARTAMATAADRFGGGTISYLALKPGAAAPQDKLSYVAPFAPWRMVVIAGAWTDDIDAAFREVLEELCATCGVPLLVTLLLAWWINRDISRSLAGLQGAMLRLAQGDLTVVVPGSDRRDEVGAMAGAVSVFRDNAIEVTRLRERQAQASAEAAQAGRTMRLQLAERFETDVGSIVGLVANSAASMKAAAQTMTEIAGSAASQSAGVAAASDQASGNVQAVASAAEQLSSSIAEISRQVVASAACAQQAAALSERSGLLVNGLAEAAQRIDAVTGLITTIAGQTNLLALNATIEAARAGEAGKGFAVVATEVKSLALRTGDATGEISRHIAAMQGATGDTVAVIREISGIIGQFNEIATTIAAAVEEQGAATREIARNVQQAADGTISVSRTVGVVTHTVEAAGDEAVKVRDAASALSDEAANLSGQVGRFMGAVKAA